jgi:spermidine/putrescine transport system ATP-binding protein
MRGPDTPDVAAAGAVELRDVQVNFGGFVAVHKTSLKINSGEFFSFLGPSGCGKTTLLRTISGFIEPSAGQVRIGGVDMKGKRPNNRPTSLIFQNLALFPLMTVADNIGYGLRARGVARPVREKKVGTLLDLVSLSGQGGKMVGELSGGQMQRVAIARSLAVEPSVLLLDEPLSALDLKLRQHMRTELRAIQKRVGITFIYITHDQGEALAMSDRVAVMNAGRIEQVGTARGIYSQPETHFVASFVGENNTINGQVAELRGPEAVVATPLGNFRGRMIGDLCLGEGAAFFIRPEALVLGRGDAPYAISGRVTDVAYEGNASQIRFVTENGQSLVARSTTGLSTDPAIGETVELGFNHNDGIVLSPDRNRP